VNKKPMTELLIFRARSPGLCGLELIAQHVVGVRAVFPGLTVRGMEPGDVISQTALVRVAIVDQAGQLR
jgi:hypothetical protein